MKELSIEDKANRYDKAIEITKSKIKNDKDHVLYEDDVMEIFPELKVSDDEKMRESIICALRNGGFYNKDKTDEAIAWLEKQKDNKDIHLLELKAKAYDDAKERMSYAYNQNRVPIGFINEIFPNIKLEKQGNNVEPKFKIGDWVVTSYGKVNQVISVNEDGDGYTLDDDTYFSGSWCDSYHLWTIKDAKDGDVLRLGDVIAIFKKYIGQEKCICYCSFCDNCYCSSCNNVGFEIPIENGEDNVYGCTNTTPATRKERDLLFQKMKEAGYEWNKDKKKLIKL